MVHFSRGKLFHKVGPATPNTLLSYFDPILKDGTGTYTKDVWQRRDRKHI